MKHYYVYIMTNNTRTLYTGVTNNLEWRVYEHKNKLVAGFTSKYNIAMLVHYEETNNVQEALVYEKQIKGWLRSKKVTLIEAKKTRMERPEFGLVRLASSYNHVISECVILSDSEGSLTWGDTNIFEKE